MHHQKNLGNDPEVFSYLLSRWTPYGSLPFRQPAYVPWKRYIQTWVSKSRRAPALDN